MLTIILPFDNKNRYDKPVNAIRKPLDDELGWDRVKSIFFLEYVSHFTYMIHASGYKIILLQLHKILYNGLLST